MKSIEELDEIEKKKLMDKMTTSFNWSMQLIELGVASVICGAMIYAAVTSGSDVMTDSFRKTVIIAVSIIWAVYVFTFIYRRFFSKQAKERKQAKLLQEMNAPAVQKREASDKKIEQARAAKKAEKKQSAEHVNLSKASGTAKK
jgi:uncharacterized membrane protein (DUF485 family)